MSSVHLNAEFARTFNGLSPEEIKAVMAIRADRAAIEARFAFRRKAIQVARKFEVWSRRTGQGLTFSTFVNTFGYEEPDCKAVYDAVKRIFEAALPQ